MAGRRLGAPGSFLLSTYRGSHESRRASGTWVPLGKEKEH